MLKPLFTALVLGAMALPVLAAEDPIGARKVLMQNNGAAAGLASGMLKGEIEYTPTAGKAVLAAFNATSQVYGDYFPEGSDSDPRTTASPKIWEDAAGFQAELDKLKAATDAGFEAAGKDGPADIEAFKAATGPIFGTCKGCHEGYRVKK